MTSCPKCNPGKTRSGFKVGDIVQLNAEDPHHTFSMDAHLRVKEIKIGEGFGGADLIIVEPADDYFPYADYNVRLLENPGNPKKKLN